MKKPLKYIDEINTFEFVIRERKDKDFIVDFYFLRGKGLSRKLLAHDLHLTPMELREMSFRLIAKIYWDKKTFTEKDAGAIWNANIPVTYGSGGESVFIKHKDKLNRWLKSKQ